MGTQVTRIVASTVDECRPPAAQHRYADDVHTGRCDDTTIVAHTAPAIEDGHVKPRIIGTVPRGPDDGPDLTVLEVES